MAQVTLEEATTNPQPSPRRQTGSAVGIVTYIADDFDAPLDGFDDGDEAEENKRAGFPRPYVLSPT